MDRCRWRSSSRLPVSHRWRNRPARRHISARLRPSHDPLQSLRPLDPHGCLRPHIRRPRCAGWPARAADDRHHSPQGAAHRRQPASKGAFPRCIGRTKGGLNSKLHAACDGRGRPVILLLTEGQASDHRGAALILPRLPVGARQLIAERGYDSARFRDALTTRGITPCIPSTRSRKQPVPHDALIYRQRHRIETILGRIKEWRRHDNHIRPHSSLGYRPPDPQRCQWPGRRSAQERGRLRWTTRIPHGSLDGGWSHACGGRLPRRTAAKRIGRLRPAATSPRRSAHVQRELRGATARGRAQNQSGLHHRGCLQRLPSL